MSTEPKLLFVSGVLFISFNVFSNEHPSSDDIYFAQGSIGDKIELSKLLNDKDLAEFNKIIYKALTDYLNYLNTKYNVKNSITTGIAVYKYKLEILKYLLHLLSSYLGYESTVWVKNPNEQIYKYTTTGKKEEYEATIRELSSLKLPNTDKLRQYKKHYFFLFDAYAIGGRGLTKEDRERMSVKDDDKYFPN